MIHDAQLLLGLSRHLSAYSISPVHAALDSLQFAGQVYELAWRLRQSQLSSAERIRAIAIEAKIGPRQLEREVLPTLEQLGWVQCQRDTNGQLLNVAALIPPANELIASASRLLDIVLADQTQRAALTILRATTRQPLERTACLAEAAAHGEQEAEAALRHLTAINLVRQVRGDDGRTAVFNPNIWVGNEKVAAAALKTEDARVRTEVGALLEEVGASPGLPEAHVTSTEQRWVDFAVGVGLIERTVVQTANGAEQRFLFAPHMGRDPFGVAHGDPSGHVRQLVGSMIYASTFASWKLRSPGAFLYVLIRDGQAGGHERIAEDYPMLETAGTIRVVGTGRNAAMQLLQADVAEAALEIIDSRGSHVGGSIDGVESLGDLRSYTHLERERAELASRVTLDDADARRIIDALRDTTAKRDF
ncbi:hypothetical protein SAMN05421833_125111 [Microbispora rosea]|uniref:Uncharacterized protein n=1 Tax=Microbispora rosea TaxID=58117 RepID=A0A1N7G244_9ACTN|nr:hypothetical protein [Microbispora rosea]GIH51240.1 hypothetical protein Mro03_64190 [Microbispora rosea subsp. rosea]SIS06673.1 hypothetical protein SAMN05421833_125111 [Microbispora rosea]